MDSTKTDDIRTDASGASVEAADTAGVGGKASGTTGKAAPKRARAAAVPPKPRTTTTRTTAVPPPPMAGQRDADDDDMDDDDQDTSDGAGADLKKQELIARVVERSDVRKKYAKPVVEAMIEILAETLAEGREMNLPPFGKLKLNRTKETERARIIIAKIRQPRTDAVDGEKPAKEAVADSED